METINKSRKVSFSQKLNALRPYMEQTERYIESNHAAKDTFLYRVESQMYLRGTVEVPFDEDQDFFSTKTHASVTAFAVFSVRNFIRDAERLRRVGKLEESIRNNIELDIRSFAVALGMACGWAVKEELLINGPKGHLVRANFMRHIDHGYGFMKLWEMTKGDIVPTKDTKHELIEEADDFIRDYFIDLL